MVEPSPRAIRTIMHQGSSARAELDELLGQVASNKAAGSCNENSLACHDKRRRAARAGAPSASTSLRGREKSSYRPGPTSERFSPSSTTTPAAKHTRWIVDGAQ